MSRTSGGSGGAEAAPSPRPASAAAAVCAAAPSSPAPAAVASAEVVGGAPASDAAGVPVGAGRLASTGPLGPKRSSSTSSSWAKSWGRGGQIRGSTSPAAEEALVSAVSGALVRAVSVRCLGPPSRSLQQGSGNLPKCEISINVYVRGAWLKGASSEGLPAAVKGCRPPTATSHAWCRSGIN